MAKTQHLHHEFGPLYDGASRVLILGSFPSVKSREAAFYYGHPQNRFWRIMRCLDDPALRTKVLEEDLRTIDLDGCSNIPEKSCLILRNHLALWDTIESCTVTGSADSSIRDVVPNDMSVILDAAPIRAICCNGATSYQLFLKYARAPMEAWCEEQHYAERADCGWLRERQLLSPLIVKLPSTSPANASFRLSRLLLEWQTILDLTK